METPVQTKRKRGLGIAIALGAVALLAILFFAYLLPYVIRPAKQYEQAQSLLAAEQYEEAMAAFTALNGYKDSAAQIVACQNALKDKAYDEAVALYETGQYEGAISAFTALIGYKDSAAQIDKCQYALRDRAYDAAVALRKAAQYEEAISAFLALNGHRDSVEQIDLCKKDRAYDAAAALQKAGQYEDAIAAFEAMDGYRDSVEQIERCNTAIKDRAYDAAVALYDAGQYEDAIAAFEALNGHRDSAEQIEKCNTAILDQAYDAAVALYEAGRYEVAISAFEALDGYRDSAEQIEACRYAIKDNAYDEAMFRYSHGWYEDALAIFESLDGHRDSAEWTEKCKTAIKDRAYDAAVALFEAGQYEDSIAAFKALDGHRDSAAYIETCKKGIDYDQAVALYEAGRYEEAKTAFEALDGYKDSVAQIEKCETAILDSLIGVHTWSVIGSICGTSWDKDFPMAEKELGVYESEPLRLNAGEELKIRADGDWTVNRGVLDKFEGYDYQAVADGPNIKVAADGLYLIRYDENTKRLSMIPLPYKTTLTVAGDIRTLRADKNNRVTVTGTTDPGATLIATPAAEYRSSMACGTLTVDSKGNFSFEVIFDNDFYGMASILLTAQVEDLEESEITCHVARMYSDRASAIKSYSKTKSYYEVGNTIGFSKIMENPADGGLYRFVGKVLEVDSETGIVTFAAKANSKEIVNIFVSNASSNWLPDNHIGKAYKLYCTLNGLYTDGNSLYVTAWFVLND